jgi:hypothetical protein
MDTAGISAADRAELRKAVAAADDYQDNTEYIRQNKCSDRIRADIATMERLRRETAAAEFAARAQTECVYLYTNYPDVFKRAAAGTLDPAIMARMLDVLKGIETGAMEQQEGSLVMGRILKTAYVDPAVRPAAAAPLVVAPATTGVSWREYKASRSR